MTSPLVVQRSGVPLLHDKSEPAAGMDYSLGLVRIRQKPRASEIKLEHEHRTKGNMVPCSNGTYMALSVFQVFHTCVRSIRS